MQINTLKILFYLLILVLAACHPSVPVNRDLKLVNSIIEEHPDTALYVLEKISAPHQMQQKEYAMYCLLKTQAEDMNHFLHTSDQEIMVAVDYFKEHSDPIFKFKSYYYLARVQETMGQYNLAVETYQIAFSIADEMGDYGYAAMAFENLSTLYELQGQYPQALDMQKRAYHNHLLTIAGKEKNPWYITIVGLLIIGFLEVFIVRYSVRIRSKEKQVGYQERQLNAAKNIITKQKAELLVL